jgi:mitochondrial fission protein ELM1
VQFVNKMPVMMIAYYIYIHIYRGYSTSSQQQSVNKTPVMMIAAGAYSSAAVTIDGMVWLWGCGA